MWGTIHCDTLAEVAEFLNEHMKTGSTAVFTVREDISTKRWKITFDGAY